MVNISRRKIIRNLALAAPLGVIGGKSFGEAGRSLGEAAFSIIYDPGRDPELIKLRNGRSPPYTGNHLELTEDKKPSLEQIVESKPEVQNTQVSYEYGIQLSSNANPFLANVNVQVLRNKGLPAFIQEFNHNGRRFYRTVVAATKATEPAITEKINEVGGFPSKFAYTNLGGFVTRTPARNVPEVHSYYISPLERELNDKLNKMSRSEFISELVPIISIYHQNTEGKSQYKEMLHQSPEKIASQIYDAANRIGIPVSSAVSLVATESSFRNVMGDEKLGTDERAEGYTQIRKPTQQLVFNQLKREGFARLQDELPATILMRPELQFLLGFRYFKDCEAKNPGYGYSAYRLGPNSNRIRTANQPGYNKAIAFIGKMLNTQ